MKDKLDFLLAGDIDEYIRSLYKEDTQIVSIYFDQYRPFNGSILWFQRKLNNCICDKIKTIF